MLRRFQAAATYWIGTAPQTLSLLVTVGVLACLTVPTLALSTGDNPSDKAGGCPPTKTGDAAPCIAKQSTDVVTPPPSSPGPSTGGGGSQGSGSGSPDASKDTPPAGGGDTAVAGAPGPSGPQPLTDNAPADGGN
ncbi:MAG: hypothetical protein M3155_06425, partial [Actinomycetota bacterium]|nr:hypothetical protein [Actinomycetota bacterium]